MGSLATGLFFLGLAIGGAALAALIVRAIPRLRPMVEHEPPTQLLESSDLPENEDAVIIVGAGGKISYTNERIREWLNLADDAEPNLEHIARRARPSDTFLGLCATPAQARFSMQGLMVEGASYAIPQEDGVAMLVSLRRPDLSLLTDIQDSTSSLRALDILTELSQTMTASLDLSDTLQAILESVERLIPSDLSEITIWEPAQKYLVPYGFAGLPGVDRRLERASIRYRAGEGYSGHVFESQEPLLIHNTESYREVFPARDRRNFPIRSFLGVPLLISGEPIGTLELGSLTTDSFTENDVEVLNALTSQAAIALKNALVHQEEARRVAELSGLAQLAQAVGTLRGFRDLFDHLLASIRPLVKTDILGFLIYDESRNRLEAQAPFEGLPEAILEMYSVAVPDEGPGAAIWKQQDPILAPEGPANESMTALGLDHMAQAAGIGDTVLLPLTSGGRMIGYLQAANKSDQSPFSSDDIRLLSIIAGQAGPILENAALIQESRRRASQAEALRKIAGLAGSAATRDEILIFSLTELARHIQADSAAIFLLWEEHFELKLHRPSLFGHRLNPGDAVPSLSTKTAEMSATAAGTLLPVVLQSGPEISQEGHFYQALSEFLECEGLVSVPIIIRDRGIGEMVLASQRPNFFTAAHVELVSTAAGQIAGAIERSTFYAQTDDGLRRRVEQLSSINRIGRELNSSLDLQQLLDLVYSEATFNTGADCGAISFYPVNQPLEGSLAPALWAGDHSGTTPSTAERQVLESGQSHLIADYASDPLPAPHEGIASSLLVPIVQADATIGLIHLHSKSVGQFDEESQDFTQTLAIQAATALENARKFHQEVEKNRLLEQGKNTLSRLRETHQALKDHAGLEGSLTAIAAGIQEATAFDKVLISIYDKDQRAFYQVSGAGISEERLRSRPVPWNSVQLLLKPEYQLGKSFFIPEDQRALDIDLPRADEMFVGNGNGQADTHGWKTDDMLLVPLANGTDIPVGLISLTAPEDGLIPSDDTLETLDLFASQALLTIDTHSKISRMSSELTELESEVDRARISSKTAQERLPFLLQKDLQQTVSIRQLSRRSRRIQAALEIVQAINEDGDAETMFETLGQEIVQHMGMDAVLIAESTSRGTILTHALGDIPQSANPGALLGQLNPLHRSLRTNTPIFVSNLTSPDILEWQSSPLLTNLQAKSFFTLPIEDPNTFNHPVTAVLGVSRTIQPEFTLEDRQIFLLIARQVSASLKNLELMSQTRYRLREVDLLLEFSSQLRSLNPDEILNTLVDSTLRVITTAHASLVAIWDEGKELLVPRSASGYQDPEKIMQITYRSGEALPGLAFQSGNPMRIAELDFAEDYSLSQENLLRYQDATAGYVPLSSLLIPVQAGDVTLGVLVLDNFRAVEAFTEEDQALITSLTQQTGLILQNARLIQDAQRRANQLQALTDTARTITSNLRVDTLIGSLLGQIDQVIPYATSTLWVREGETLRVGAAQGFPDTEDRIGLTVAIEDSQLLNQMISSGEPINVINVIDDERFPALVEPEHLSWLGIPLISKDEVIGVIALEKEEPRYYSPEHIQAAITFAGQAAVALDNAQLFEQSQRRAEALNERTERLDLLNRLSTELSGSLNPAHILGYTVDQVHEAVEVSSVSAVLIEGEQIILQSESPSVESQLPRLLSAAPIVDRLQESLGAFIADDIQAEKDLAPWLEFFEARQTRGLVILPFASGEQLHGFLMVHSDAERLEADDIELVQTIANQASVTLENARLFGQTQAALAETEEQAERLAQLNTLSTRVNLAENVQEILDATAEMTYQIFEADRVSIAILDEGGETFTVFALQDEKNAVPVGTQVQVKGSAVEAVVKNNELVLVSGAEDTGIPDIHTFMTAPLPTRDLVIGAINVGSAEFTAYDQADQNILSQIASLVSATIDNKNLLEETQSLTGQLEARVVERTAALEREHQRNETLLGIITELSASLDIDMVLNQTLHRIIEVVDAEQATIMLLRSEETQSDSPKLLRRAAVGYTPDAPGGGETSSISIDEGLAGWVIQNRTSALVPDLLEDERWLRRPEQEHEHRSALAVPIMLGEEALGSLLLFHRTPAHFVESQMELIAATGRQIAVAVNNAQLYHLIRDQAERLGGMLRSQQVEASRLRAILEAVADGVVVTDPDSRIFVFNASAGSILELDSEQVVGKSLDEFTGFFGQAGRQWTRTIRDWSADPDKLAASDTFAEQIELDDGRVIAVNLAPVQLRNDFLGTVSIFRDITHQIEVDRLKSEFVATVSHELRTPMTSIRGYVDILLMGAAGELNDQQSNFLGVVQNNTERLNILVNDLLEVSRIEAGKVALSLQRVEPAALAQEVIAEFRQSVADEGRNLPIQLQHPDSDLAVLGDAERIRQVLQNLLSNAYQYTHDGGQVDVTVIADGAFVQVAVSDSGVGIEADDFERVFERFYRGEDPLVLASAGSGLGLSIVRYLVELHGGKIWVNSSGAAGEGSTFAFTLPVFEGNEHGENIDR
jgi:PAS domain S-box-containing protein